MDADKIVKLSSDVIRDLIAAHDVNSIPKEPPHESRRSERWPFPGTVELWLPEECYGDRHVLATMHNLSAEGLAMRARRPIPVGTKISIAIHQPALSCYGHAVVRHCTQAPIGYLVGVEFLFGTSDND